MAFLTSAATMRLDKAGRLGGRYVGGLWRSRDDAAIAVARDKTGLPVG
jgi:hypothetical protein